MLRLNLHQTRTFCKTTHKYQRAIGIQAERNIAPSSPPYLYRKLLEQEMASRKVCNHINNL